MYLIFVLFVEREIFLYTENFPIYGNIYSHVHIPVLVHVCISCIDNAYPIQADFDDDKIDVLQLSFFDRDDDEAALTWKKKKTKLFYN